jgi:hypothetical protein
MSVDDHLSDIAREEAIVEMQCLQYEAEKRAEEAEAKLEKMRVSFLNEIARSEVTTSKISAIKDDVKNAELAMINIYHKLELLLDINHPDVPRPSLREHDVLNSEITKLVRCKTGIECECFKN